MSGYTRQQSYIDGDVILAEHTNDELDLLQEVFSTNLGHKHDGTAAEGATIDLLSDDDGDTKIQVEEGVDDDTIRFDTAGVERLNIGSTGDITAIGDAIFSGSATFDGTVDMNSTITVDGTTTFSTRPAFNGGTSGVDSPFTVDSTFKVTNLNAELLDNLGASQFVRSDTTDTVAGVLTFNAIPAFNGGTSGSTAPFTVDSNTVVTNLNADLLDGVQGSGYLLVGAKAADSELLDGINSLQFLRSDVDDTFNGTLNITGKLAVGSSTSNNQLHVFSGGNYGSDGETNSGITIESFQPALKLLDRSTGAGSALIGINQNSLNIFVDADVADGTIGQASTATDAHIFNATEVVSNFLNELQNNGNRVLTVADEGGGNGLDADTLDGVQGANYMRLDQDNNFSDSDFRIQADTVDGSDTSILRLSGGGASTSANRGARIQLSGNEHTNTGSVQIVSGNVVGGHITITTAGAQDIIFSTDNTERARIDNAGRILIGTTDTSLNISTTNGGFAVVNSGSTGKQLTVASDNHGANVSTIVSNKVSYVSGTTTHISIRENGTIRGSITSNGSSTSFNTSSDYRLKENVADLTGAADRLAQIPVRRFNFITNPDRTVDGFLAHEVQAVVPEAVIGEKDAVDEDGNPEYQAIDQSKLVPLLTAALQEALTEINDLKTRVTALETA